MQRVKHSSSLRDDYPSFKGKLDRWYAPYGDTLPLPFGDDGAEEDQNRGL